MGSVAGAPGRRCTIMGGDSAKNKDGCEPPFDVQNLTTTKSLVIKGAVRLCVALLELRSGDTLSIARDCTEIVLNVSGLLHRRRAFHQSRKTSAVGSSASALLGANSFTSVVRAPTPAPSTRVVVFLGVGAAKTD